MRNANRMTLSFAALSTGMLLYYFSVLSVLPAGWVAGYGRGVGAALQAVLHALSAHERKLRARVAAADARLAMPDHAIGLVPDAGSTAFLRTHLRSRSPHTPRAQSCAAAARTSRT